MEDMELKDILPWVVFAYAGFIFFLRKDKATTPEVIAIIAALIVIFSGGDENTSNNNNNNDPVDCGYEMKWDATRNSCMCDNEKGYYAIINAFGEVNINTCYKCSGSQLVQKSGMTVCDMNYFRTSLPGYALQKHNDCEEGFGAVVDLVAEFLNRDRIAQRTRIC